jgi:histidine triad (HIT) family protein
MTSEDCIFCKIVAKQIPADLVYDDGQVTGFRDVNPQAPVHILLVPNQHIANTEVLVTDNDATVGSVIRAARDIARREGIADSGYRLVINTGRDANNTVAHLHVHLIGGRGMSWPPG